MQKNWSKNDKKTSRETGFEKTDTPDKNALNRLAVKAGLFYIFAQILVRSITFLTTPIYTRLLSTEQYADIRIYESWLQIAVPTLSLCLWKSVERAKFDVGKNYNKYVACTQTLSYLSIGAFFLAALIFKEPIKQLCGCNMDDLMFFMAFAYIFSYTSILYMQRREKQMMRYKVSTLVTAVTAIPSALLSILLLWLGRQGGHTAALVDLRTLGFYIPYAATGFAIAIVLWVQGGGLISKDYWKYGLAYSLPLVPEAISIQIMNQSDKIMVSSMVGKTQAGIFSLGTTISFIIWVLEDSVWNAWLPWLFEKISRDETEDVEKPWYIIMHGFGILSLILVLLAPEIVAVLGGADYREAIWLVAPMLTGTLFRFYSYSYTAIENYHKKTGYVAFATTSVMFLNIALNYVGILLFGYRAAAYTTTFSYFVLMLLQCYMEYRITGTLIIPIKRTVAISVGYFTLCVAAMGLFYCPTPLRWAVLLLTVALAAKFLLPKCLGILKSLKS